ncbi:MAG TPA: amidase [Nannocystis sp.]|jgi:amidase
MRLLALLALALSACHPAAADPPSRSQDNPAIDLVELDITEARRRMNEGTLTSQDLTRAYLARIAELDDAGPMLGAVIELDPKALEYARLADRDRGGSKRGPLHGIPVLLKDNIDVAGMVNSAGSLAMAGNRPAKDAFLVARLRAAGAVVLGKTNLSEWANFRSTKSISGWSSRGGQTRNPYALDHNPCGSSSGTGVAISASLAAVGVGTETDGSILCPAAVSGLVGLKPTVGLISRAGIIPISATQDTPGPMARTVTDAAILLGAMVGQDPADPLTTNAPTITDYTIGLRPDALTGKRIGVLRQAMGYDPIVDATTERAIAALRAAGAVIVDPAEISTWEQWGAHELEILLFEFKAGLDAYLAHSGGPIHNIADLIAYNQAHAREVMPLFGQELLLQAQAHGGLDSPAYLQARSEARRLAWDEGLRATLERDRLDALVAPTTGPAWPTDPVNGDRIGGAGYGVAAVAGTPSLTVPMGDHHGLPLGLVFLGAPFSEAHLLAYAYAFEQATHARRPPAYHPTLPAK